MGVRRVMFLALAVSLVSFLLRFLYLHDFFSHFNVPQCFCGRCLPECLHVVLHHMFLDAEGVGFEFLSPSEHM